MEDVLVSDLARTCIDQFRGFLAIIREQPELLNTDASMAIDEQVGRFNVWAGNLGVFARAHASLDYRLRDNPRAKDLALKQLEGLQDRIERGMFDRIASREPHTLPLRTESSYWSYQRE